MTNDIRLVGVTGEQGETSSLPSITPMEWREQEGNTILRAVGSNNDTVAVLTFSVHARTLQLEFFSVNEDKRRKGIGTDIIEELTDSLAAEDEQWFLQAEFLDDREHEALAGFFQKQQNFFLERRNTIYRAPAALRAGMGEYQKLRKTGERINSFQFYSLSKQIQDFFWKELSEAGHPIIKGGRVFDRKLCLCDMHNGRISSAVFVCSSDSGEYELYFLFGRPGFATSLKRVFCRVVWLIEHQNPQADLILNATSKEERMLVASIFEGRVPPETLCVAFWNGIGATMMKRVLRMPPK